MIDEMPVNVYGRDLPSFRLRQEDLPNIGYWDVNSQHYLVLKVELVGKQNTKSMGINNSEDREKVEGTFQVLNVKPLSDTPVDAKTLEKQDMARVVANLRSGSM